MAVDPDDEFFGRDDDDTPSHTFGNVASQEFRSREANVAKLSYLDGYDETKEEKLQDGFSNGYRQSFNDAFRIGCRLGSSCAKMAMDESVTLGLPFSSGASATTTNNADVEITAKLVRKFLVDEVLIGSKEGDDNRYDEALLQLKDELTKLGTM